MEPAALHVMCPAADTGRVWGEQGSRGRGRPSAVHVLGEGLLPPLSVVAGTPSVVCVPECLTRDP